MVSLVASPDASSQTTSASTLPGVTWMSHLAADVPVLAWAMLNTATPTLDAAFSIPTGGQVVDTNLRGIVATKTSVTGSESGDVSLSCDAPNASRMSGALALYRGSSGIAQIVSLGEPSGSPVTTHACPQITPQNANSAFVMVYMDRVSTGNTSVTPPTGFSKAVEFGTSGSGGTYVQICHDLSGTHGLSAFTPASWSVTVGSTSAIVFLLELPPSTLSVTLGLALETDAALALASSKLATLAVATEADAAVALSSSKSANLGLASEADSALAVAVSKAVALGLATEIDAALALTTAKTASLAVAAETDTALPVSAAKAVTFGVATETEVALALVISKQVTLGVATEADTALPVSISSLVGVVLAVATETDAALPLTTTKQVVLGVAAEADEALPLAPSKALTLATATEVDTAFALIVGIAQPSEPGHLVAINSGPQLATGNEPSSRLEASHDL